MEFDEGMFDDSRPRYEIRNVSYALSHQEPLDYVVKGLISRGSLNVIYGKPGVGKTYAMLSLASCVALGIPWCGFDTKPVKCMFIDEESGETRLNLRISEVVRGLSADGNTPLVYNSLGRFRLDNKYDVTELQSIINQEGIGMIVFDALSDIMDGNENDKKDVQRVMNAMRWLAEKTKIEIALVHHTSKTGKNYRGSSAIEGSCNTMTQINLDKRSGIIHFKTEKARDFEPVSWSAKPTWNKN